MNRLKILQVFSKYLNYGGEEGTIYAIGEAMGKDFDIEYFISQSADLLKKSPLTLPLRAYRNTDVLKELHDLHKREKFDFWQIHNVFPAISPGAYSLAADLDVPIVHYLHNYRMGCLNGYLYTQGANCQRCATGQFLHGAIRGCWRESRAQSSMMAILLADTRRIGLFNQVKKWIAISEAQKKLHITIGLPEENIEVIPHFLDHNPADRPSKHPHDGYGLFIGRLSPEKGVDQLIKAWATLPKNRKLLIAGDGPELEKLQALVKSYGLKNVTFNGFVAKSQHATLWEGAAFLVVPSMWQEPFGMVVLEAWAKGRPVIAHAVGALPEIIDHGRTGLLADPQVPGSLASALDTAFTSADLQRMGDEGFEELLSRYNKSLWSAKINKVYSSLGR